MEKGYAKGVFQVGIMVSDIDECIRLFCDTLGMWSLMPETRYSRLRDYREWKSR